MEFVLLSRDTNEDETVIVLALSIWLDNRVHEVQLTMQLCLQEARTTPR